MEAEDMLSEYLNYRDKKIPRQERIAFLKKVMQDKSLKAEFIKYQNLDALLCLQKQPNDRKQGEFYLINLMHQVRRKNSFRRILYTILSTAAVVLILLGGWLVTSLHDSSQSDSSMERVFVPAGQRMSLTLSDGTVVQLNSNSELQYPKVFKGKERRLFLNGEAFFKVAKDAARPFVVSSYGVDVMALGTEFNVMSYSQNQYTTVYLKEGMVKVYEPTLEENAIILEPQQELHYEDGKSDVRTVQLDSDSWQYGIYSFENESLENIVRRLSIYSGTQIQIENPKLKVKRYTGELNRAEDIEETLKVLQKVYKFQIKKENTNEFILL